MHINLFEYGMCVSLGPPNIHCNVSWHFENTLFPLSKVTLNVLGKDFLVNTINVVMK